jgi:hypothetical protein
MQCTPLPSFYLSTRRVAPGTFTRCRQVAVLRPGFNLTVGVVTVIGSQSPQPCDAVHGRALLACLMNAP